MSNTIVLKGKGIRKERLSDAVITPGELVELMSTGLISPHANAGLLAQKSWAVENEVIGGEIDDDYASGDNVIYEVLPYGAEVNALVPASAAAIVIGDKLESNGDGTVRKQTPGSGSASDGLYDSGTIAISATAEDFKTTTTMVIILDAVQYDKAATDNLAFSAADTINVGAGAPVVFGAWLCQVNAAGAVSTKPAGGLSDQVYVDAATALAALPPADADNVAFATIVLSANVSSAWTANTDDMTPASDVASAAFADLSTLSETSPSNAIVGLALEAVDNSAGGAEVRLKLEVL